VKKLAPNAYKIDPKVLRTRLLRTKAPDGLFTGSAAAFDPTNSPASLRLDPEGVRASACGDTVYISDEYGPFVYEFRISNGKRVRSLDLPHKFLIDFPSANPTEELTKNAFGRQANRGMEGLAISPDGSKLYGIMQSALIQDGALKGTSRIGLNNRIVEIDVETGAVREFVYQLDAASNGVSEIVAVNDRELLVLERRPGREQRQVQEDLQDRHSSADDPRHQHAANLGPARGRTAGDEIAVHRHARGEVRARRADLSREARGPRLRARARRRAAPPVRRER
jgi:hypothetical protein